MANFVTDICDVKAMADYMAQMDIDLKKMPLGKLSKKQINKGWCIVWNQLFFCWLLCCLFEKGYLILKRVEKALASSSATSVNKKKIKKYSKNKPFML